MIEGEVSRNRYRRVSFDLPLLISTILLVAIGVTMVYSSSALLAADRFGDSNYFLKREAVFVAVGFIIMFVAMRIPYWKWRRLVYPTLMLAVFLLILTLVPGLHGGDGRVARWVKIGGFSFQPSEFAKISVIFFLAHSLVKKLPIIKTFMFGFLPNVIVIGFVSLLIVGGRDLGSAVLVALLSFAMFFIAGVRILYLAGAFISSLPFLYIAVASVAYRRQRVLAFLDPWSDRYGSGFQMIQSFVAFSQGGVFGQGLGEGKQKLFYLPEAHTDFIASVIGEELGMVGIFCVVLLFVIYAWRGFRASFRAPDLFGRYLAFGITMFISLQAMLNLSVVTGLVPTKGMVLPFISYGGSALMSMLFATGILLNISSYRRVDPVFREFGR